MRQGISLKFILYQFLFALKEGQDTKDFVQNFPSCDAAITANGAPQLVPGVILVGLIHNVVINIADDSGIVALLILFSRNWIFFDSLLEFIKVHPVNLHALSTDFGLHQCFQRVRSKVFIPIRINRWSTRRHTTALESGQL